MSLVFFLTGWGSAILVADFADSYWLSATVYYSEVENNGVKTTHTTKTRPETVGKHPKYAILLGKHVFLNAFLTIRF